MAVRRRKENNTIKTLIEVLLALVLIVAGIVMVVMTLQEYRSTLVSDFDENLWNAQGTVDYNIVSMLDRFDEDLEFSVTRKAFLESEDRWLRYGNAYRLRTSMNNSALANRESFRTMLALKDGKIAVSSDENMDYVLTREIRDGIFECKDPEGADCLAFVYTIDDTLSYAAVMSMDTMYAQIIKQSSGTGSEISMLDSAGGILVQQGENKASADIIRRTEEKGAKAISSYYASTSKDKEKTEMRMAVIPSAETENGIFAIGISANYGTTTELMRVTTVRLVVFTSVVVIGLFMVIVFLILNRRRIAMADLELEELKEKNAAMEELNRKTQELAHHQRLETIGTMTSSIAHEFNNLLTPIMGYSLMTLEKLPEDVEMYDDVLEIYNASEKASDIISRLSDLSRKNTEMVFEELSPDALVNKVLNVTAPALPRNVDIERNLTCPDKIIYGNEVQLSQLLLNLVINAFHAMQEKGGKLYVSTEKDGNNVLFTVSDEGKGIPKDVIDNIFDPFFTTKGAGMGTGLGLAIAEQAVSDHNGRIEVQSEEGTGATFRVYIPVSDRN